MGTRVSFTSGQNVKLTVYLQVVLRSRMFGASLPWPLMPLYGMVFMYTDNFISAFNSEGINL